MKMLPHSKANILTALLIVATTLTSLRVPTSGQTFEDLFTFANLNDRSRVDLRSIQSRVTTDAVNFESPHVHPLALSPDSRWLAAANTYGHHVEIFEMVDGVPKSRDRIYTGLDPVTVRFRTDDELWVVNHLSDSVAVIEVPSGKLRHLLPTEDEPADVVFSASAERAYVSCSQVNKLLAYDLNQLDASPEVIPIEGEDPRAMAVSPDGRYLYTAIFESGNATTTLGGGRANDDLIAYPGNAVSDPKGPYGGVNPPPNDGDEFSPDRIMWTKRPPVGLIVRKSDQGRWMDDNERDWTDFVSGPYAKESGRVEGWDVIDHDIAILDTQTNEIHYAKSLMNIVMGIDVNPVDGSVTVVGTEALNHVRYEPNLKGVFLQVRQATVRSKPGGGSFTVSNTDLNPHLDYTKRSVPQEVRDQSIGNPRAIAWAADGHTAYVAGMGSNNVVVLNRDGERAAGSQTIEVGEGPSGMALSDEGDRLYVLNRFDGSISVVDTVRGKEVERVDYFDPTPTTIKDGRRHLFDTHATSGLGQASCGSCHVDARMDRLAWDLGDPGAGATTESRFVDDVTGRFQRKNVTFASEKGPMVTQTLQGIPLNGPLHWRGDKSRLEEFNPTYETLLGDDEQLTDLEIAELRVYVDNLIFPPNPFRNADHTMPASVALPEQRVVQDGEEVPLPDGNPVRGQELFQTLKFDHFEGRRCSSCHQQASTGGGYASSAPAVSELSSMSQSFFKPSNLLNVHEKIGFDAGSTASRSGFGYLHDGTIDSLTRYFTQPQFNELSEPQQLADMIAFVYSLNGSDVPTDQIIEEAQIQLSNGIVDSVIISLFGRTARASELKRRVHAGIGEQLHIDPVSVPPTSDVDVLRFLSIVDQSNDSIDAVLHAIVEGKRQPYLYDPENESFVNDRRKSIRVTTLLARDEFEGGVITLVHPLMAPILMGDSDGDGLYDHEETMDLDPYLPGVQNPFDPLNPDSTGDRSSTQFDHILDGYNDFDGDGISNIEEFRSSSPTVPPKLQVERDANGQMLLRWKARPGQSYVIEMSRNLVKWDAESPVMTAKEGQEMMEWRPTAWTKRYTTRFFRLWEVYE